MRPKSLGGVIPLALGLLIPSVLGDVLVEKPEDYTEEKLGHQPFQSFVTRPDLHTPIVNMNWINSEPPSAQDDSLFVMTIHGNNVNPWLGALLLKPQDGTPIWISHDYNQMFNLQVQNFRGKPHLTFWHANQTAKGYGYIMNQHYEVVKKVRTANEQVLGDLHEFKLTDSGSALIAYQTKAELSYRGKSFWVRDGCFQDVDVETGELILDWCSSQSVPVSDTYVNIDSNHGQSWSELDYIHLNSVDKDASTGNYLVSGRHTHTLYVVSPEGEVLHRIGGRQSDFEFGEDAKFSWQHDARFVSVSGWNDWAVSLFDNAWDRIHPAQRKQSRGLLLGVDRQHKNVFALGSYESPVEHPTGSQGSMQVLPNEEVVVGFGLLPHVAQYKADGTMKLHIQYGFDAESYRSTLKPWTGMPKTQPDIAIEESGREHGSGAAKVFVSWNGATDVAQWRIAASNFPDPSNARPTTTALCPRQGFESVCAVNTEYRWVQAHALAANGTLLGMSDWLRRAGEGLDGPEFENVQALESGFQAPKEVGHLSSDGDLDEALDVGSQILAQWFRAVNYIGTGLRQRPRPKRRQS